MAIATATYKLDPSSPSRSGPLRMRFEPALLNGKSKVLMLQPESDPSHEPTFTRYLAGIILKTGDGTIAKELGQVLITDQRVLGMITSGTVGDRTLDMDAGSVFVFTIDREDLGRPQTNTNWRGKPIEVQLRSKAGRAPAVLLQVFSVVVAVKNDGSIIPTRIDSFIKALGEWPGSG